MVTHDSSADGPSATRLRSLLAGLFCTDHKTIGLRYLWLALSSVLAGMVISLAMRMELVGPATHPPLLSRFGATPDRNAALTLLHGSLMIFAVLTAAPQAGLGTYLAPV